MLKLHLRTAIKTLLHQKVFSFVNVFGLTLGLSACMVVANVVIDDLSYDRNWSKSKDLYRILSIQDMGSGMTERMSASYAGLGPELRKNFPEVQAVSAIVQESMRLRFNTGDPAGVALTELRADTTVWQLLDLPLKAGSPRVYTEGVNNIVISESVAKRFFAGRNPLGRTVQEVSAYGEKPESYVITGVMKDLPYNTHLRAEVLVLDKPRVESLGNRSAGTFLSQYILLRPGTDAGAFTQKVNRWYADFMKDARVYRYAFQPIRDVYLRSDFNDSQNVKGSMRNIYIFSAVAALLLLIACINYINLSTARVVSRLKETGTRKILGARRKDIVLQSLAESVLVFALSLGLSIFIYRLALHPLEDYLGYSLELTFLSRLSLLGIACGTVFLVSLFTGLYPAWLLSGVPVAGALKGRLFKSSQSWLRKGLVVVQFSISIVVLVGMIVVKGQVNYMTKADPGFDRKGLLSIGFVSWDGKGDVFKQALLGVPGVEGCSITTFLPSSGPGFMSRDQDDPLHPGNKVKVWYMSGDIDLEKVLGLRLKSGRLFDPALSTDAWVYDFSEKMKEQPSLITASTAEMLNIQDLHTIPGDVYSHPVGIVEDFHSQSMRDAMGPTFILAERSPQYGGMLIRVQSGAEGRVMASIHRLWRQMYPGKLLETHWVDEMLTDQYAQESRFQQLLTFFSGLSMILAALGIFGLIVHAAGQRIKEIGVRRVLGASVASIVRLLASDFARLVCIAFLVAAPLSWWVMQKWLEGFAYRIHIQWWMPVLAGTVALVISLITISFQAIKSALAPPVESLRAE